MEKILNILNKLSSKLFEYRKTIFKLKNIVIFFMVLHLLSSLYGTYQSGYCVNCSELTPPQVKWGEDPLVLQERTENFNSQKTYRPFDSTKEYLISFSIVYFPTLLFFMLAIGLTYTMIRFVGLVIAKVFFGDETRLKRMWKKIKGLEKR